jgi:hypothetical protein
MAFSDWAYLTAASSGATRNSGTNGDLVALLDWALTSNSNWTQVYSDGGSPVKKAGWQPAGGGPILMVNHDSAVSGSAALATVRGCESQSGGTMTDPFPTATQVTDGSCTWMVSNSANTTTRDFHIVVWETGIVYATRYSGASDTWEIAYFVQGIPRYGASDATYNWICGTRGQTGVSAAMIHQTTSQLVSATQGNYAMRNIQGTIKSERGNLCANGTSLGLSASAPIIAGGYGSTIDRAKISFNGMASSTTTAGATTVLQRLIIPHLWSPVHSSNSGVSETDTINDGSTQLILLKDSANSILLHITNDFPATFP